MTKIIWMSDPHFQNAGTIDGLNPRVRWAAAIDHINAHHADADFVVVSGDLVGDDIEGDYSGIARYLAQSKLPVYPMIGNNDDRDGLRAHLAIPANAMPGFVQYAIDTYDSAYLLLDTQKRGSHAGELCPARKEWLEHALEARRDKPVYVFMHHPPVSLHLPAQDEIMLENADGFLDLIGRYSNVKHLFMGHVHRPTCGTVRGIPFATIGAVSFQAPAPRPEWHWDSFVAPAEAPHYGVLHITDGDVTLQYTQFCSYETGIEN
ncbi:phosphodiesterase [Loktanella sp. S4079]|uniref:phosphodiesterase n=1 Tax=Loktanella sp. S4079 TaxID=579483 RepID=UPI0005FA6966|nr:phosphodiesterase [Loktanella sp. S4079]KJZ21117.1 hypothetical protein TW80_00195 [Loktanella sp. S4079]